MMRRALLIGLIGGIVFWWCAPALAQLDPSVFGRWSSAPQLPWFPTAAHMLPTGQVLIYSGDPQGIPPGVPGDTQLLWSPSSGTTTSIPGSGYDLFCSGHSFLADGRLLIAGGHTANFVGLRSASTYDPFANTWTRLPDMNAGRWYPTSTTLSNGDALVVSGSIDNTVGVNRLPQVFQAASGTWRDLTTALLGLDLYPQMHLAPNGKVFSAAPSEVTRYLDAAGTGAWSFVANRTSGHRDYGSSVLYADGKVLHLGGGDPPTNAAEVIDLNQAVPTWRSVPPMASARRQANATILPDGKVLVTGGTSGPGFNNPTTPVFEAEMWDPTTEAWTTMAAAQVPRLYHSVAVLLPDGRIFSAGGNGYSDVEIYEPPYLFKGARPTITLAPASVSHGQTFFVETPQAADIAAVTWIRLPSVTHAFNQNQRINRLGFSQTKGGLNVTAPQSPNLAPPGHYMLFILNSNGVPSIAKIVKIDVADSIPILKSLAPTSTPAGGAAFTLTVNGGNFVGTSEVRWNGAARTTTFVNAGQVTAAIPASDIVTQGSAQVTVVNPAPGGESLNVLSFTISAPVNLVPALTSLAPPSTAAGGAAFTLTVNGSNFVGTSQVRWNGAARTTTFVNAGRVTAAIPASDIGTPGSAQVTVVTPTSDWMICAAEGDVCAFTGTEEVRYGANGSYFYMSLTGGTACTNSVFGDPIPGTAKQCAIRMTAASNVLPFTISAPANPALTSLAPPSTAAGGGAFTLTVNGSNFVGTSQVRWNGTGRPTTVVNAGQVTAAIPASDIVTPGSAQVTVVTPTSDWTICAAEGGVCAFTGTEEVRYGANGSYFYMSLTGGTACTNSVFGDPIPGTAKQCAIRMTAASNALPFTISASANPVPALTSLAPTSTAAGGAAFTLTVNGSNFVGTSQVRWNGTGRTTTFVSAGQVTAAIPASDIVTQGSAQVTVVTPAPGGGPSNILTFTISAPANPVPILTSLAPTSTAAGGAAFTLTVNGSNFVGTSQVRWNGAARTTTFVNAGRVTAAIPASDIGTQGSAQVTVVTPAPGGGPSNILTFTISAPGTLVPILTSLAPPSTLAGGAAFTLTVNGSNFVGTSQVRWNGTGRTTTFVNAGQVTAAIPASDIGTPGSAQVTVVTPTSDWTICAAEGGVCAFTGTEEVRYGANGSYFYMSLTGGTACTNSVFGDPIFGTAKQCAIRMTAASNAVPFTISAPATPVPALTSLAPPSTAAGGAAFTLTVNGSNFVGTSQVRWNGTGRTTTVVNAGQVTAAIPASDIVTPGSAQVTVVNPISDWTICAAEGGVCAFTGTEEVRYGANGSYFYMSLTGGTACTNSVFGDPIFGTAKQCAIRMTAASNVLTFTISASANPVPAVTSLAPTSRPAGGAAFTLTVNGSNFVGTSQVRWNGAARTTTFVNAGQVTAAIPASDIGTPGSAQVTVVTPAPGGGTSNILSFTISAPNPVPTLTSLAPTSTAAGGAAFTLTVNGSNFVGTSQVRWNGAARTTTFVNAGQMTAAIPASDITTQGSAQVTVVNPAPGGGTSNILTFTISAPANPAPILTSLAPTSRPAGGTAFTLTVNGSNFVGTSQVRWNGTGRTTTFVNAGRVTAAIPASDITTQGSAQVTVVNPTPGGGTSNILTFTISAPNLTSLAPTSTAAGGAAFTLTVNGSNFVGTSQVRWNGAARTTTVVSAGQVTAAIPGTTSSPRGARR